MRMEREKKKFTVRRLLKNILLQKDYKQKQIFSL